MRALLTRFACLAGLVLCAVATGEGAARAQEGPAAEVLKGHDLNRAQGLTWVLADEQPILKAFKDAQALGARLKSGEAQRREIESGNQDPKALAEYYRAQVGMLTQQSNEIGMQMQQLGPYSGRTATNSYRAILNQQRSQIAQEQRRLNAMIADINRQGPQFEQQKKKFVAEVEGLRKAHKEAVDALQESVDKALARYNELAKDEPVEKALVNLSATSKTRQKLGPSKDLLNVVKWLGGSATAQAETIELRREGKADLVEVQLNGRSPVRMVLDTTADQTTLPAGLAASQGLKPTGGSVECQDATGAKVACKEMTISSVRVGRLTAKDVTCAVLPEDKDDAAPRLGLSFLKHFDYKHLPDAGRLVLIPLEPEEHAAKPGPGASSRARSSSRQPRSANKSKAATGKRRPPASGDGSGPDSSPPPV